MAAAFTRWTHNSLKPSATTGERRRPLQVEATLVEAPLVEAQVIRVAVGSGVLVANSTTTEWRMVQDPRTAMRDPSAKTPPAVGLPRRKRHPTLRVRRQDHLCRPPRRRRPHRLRRHHHCSWSPRRQACSTSRAVAVTGQSRSTHHSYRMPVTMVIAQSLLQSTAQLQIHLDRRSTLRDRTIRPCPIRTPSRWDTRTPLLTGASRGIVGMPLARCA
jgi:hypothetical protein